MKRLTILILLLLTIITTSALAYDVSVENSLDNQIVLSFSNLNTIDIKVSNLVATVETSTLSDSYVADYTLTTSGDKVLLTIDTTPINEDYERISIDSILVSGSLDSNGVSSEFSKRIFMRDNTQVNRQLAPILETSTLIYWVTGLAILLVILVLVIVLKKRKQHVIVKKTIKRKRKSLKKVVKKKIKKTSKKKRI